MEAGGKRWWLPVLNQRWADEFKEAVQTCLTEVMLGNLGGGVLPRHTAHVDDDDDDSDDDESVPECVLLEGVVFMCFSNGTLPPWTFWGPGSPNAWISSSTSTSWRSSSGSQRWGAVGVGGDGKHPPISWHIREFVGHEPLLSPYRKSTGTSGCRGSSTRPSTARCTTRCATGWPWRRPRLRWGKEACRASPWRTAMRRTKRTTRAHTHRLPKPPRPLCSP